VLWFANHHWQCFGAWQEAMISKWGAMFFGPQFGWLYLLFIVSAVVFVSARTAAIAELLRKNNISFVRAQHAAP